MSKDEQAFCLFPIDGWLLADSWKSSFRTTCICFLNQIGSMHINFYKDRKEESACTLKKRLYRLRDLGHGSCRQPKPCRRKCCRLSINRPSNTLWKKPLLRE